MDFRVVMAMFIQIPLFFGPPCIKEACPGEGLAGAGEAGDGWPGEEAEAGGGQQPPDGEWGTWQLAVAGIQIGDFEKAWHQPALVFYWYPCLQ